MKKRFITIALTMVLLTTVLCCSGCSIFTSPPENVIKFGSFTQQERKDYINNFLEQEYGLSGEVSDVKQKQISPFQFEDHYFAMVTTPDNDVISVWVSKKGEITDTVFLLNMQDYIYDYFEPIITEIIPGCKLRIYTEMLDRPTSTLAKGDDIKNFLTNQNTFTFFHVFLDKDAEIDETILDDLEQVLNYCECSVDIFLCEDLESVDVYNYDLHTYTYYRHIEKQE